MKTYYFTFMGRQGLLKDRYLKLNGTFGETRQAVLDAIGTQWAFQYDEERFLPQIDEYSLKEISLEEAADVLKENCYD